MAHITDRFYNARWGVFNHYLGGRMSTGEDWNACVDSFDCEKLAATLHKMGAGYYFITLMQGRKYMCAPNETFDRIAGTKPGEACSKRDLVADLYDALSVYGIDLYLYYTGDGPYIDREIGARFGFVEPRRNITETFVKNWAAVLEEYALRYGDKVKGWWIDGCYSDMFGYTDALLQHYYDAVKRGNPEAIVSFNNGDAVREDVLDGRREPSLVKASSLEDFTSGEFQDFIYLPKQAFVDSSRSHMLIPLGIASNGGWCARGCKRDHAYIKDFVNHVHAAGGVVTIDIFVDLQGNLDDEQVNTLMGI
ncbi:MAG: alpha-L-fucosidase [Clostridia bacterium]|nr:alpha-L-fucosidase [Clostridia bacterium]